MKTTHYSATGRLSGKLRPRLVALATTFLLAAPAAWAQAPVNDNCSGAIALTVGATCVPVTTTNVGATASTGVVAPSCGGANAGVDDVWYSVVVPASGSVTVATRLDAASAMDDTVLELYTGTCGTLTSIGCNDDFGGGAASSFTARSLTPGSTVYARVFGYDDAVPTGSFGICAVAAAALPASDAAVQAIYATGKAPVSAPQVVQVVVRNAGSAALANVPVTLTVSGATTFADAKIIPTLAAGASTIVTFTGYTPTAAGNNTLTVTLQPDGDNTNNTQTYAQTVTANTLSYIDASQPLNPTGIGVNTGSLISRFTINSAATIGSVSLSLAAVASTTSTYQVVVLDATGAGGLPGAVLFTSPTQTRTAAAGVVTVPVTGAVSVNGAFYAGVREVSGSVQLAYQVESPLRVATHYAQLPGAATWLDVSTLAVGGAPATTRLGIEVTFGTRVLSTNSPALARSISMYPNPAQGQVTLDIREAKAKGALQVQITNALGQVVHTATVRDNAENKLDLSGLANGLYVLRVSTGSEYSIRQLVLNK